MQSSIASVSASNGTTNSGSLLGSSAISSNNSRSENEQQPRRVVGRDAVTASSSSSSSARVRKSYFSQDMLSWRPPAWLDFFHNLMFSFSFERQHPRPPLNLHAAMAAARSPTLPFPASAAATPKPNTFTRTPQHKSRNTVKKSGRISAQSDSKPQQQVQQQQQRGATTADEPDELLVQVIRRNLFVRAGFALAPCFGVIGMHWLATGLGATKESSEVAADGVSSSLLYLVAGAANVFHSFFSFVPIAICVAGWCRLCCSSSSSSSSSADSDKIDSGINSSSSFVAPLVAFSACTLMAALFIAAVCIPTFPVAVAVWVGCSSTVFILPKHYVFSLWYFAVGSLIFLLSTYNMSFYTARNQELSRILNDLVAAKQVAWNLTAAGNFSSAQLHNLTLTAAAAVDWWQPLLLPGAPRGSEALNWMYWGLSFSGAIGVCFLTSYPTAMLCAVAQRLVSNAAVGRKLAAGVKRWDLAAVESAVAEYEKLPYADEKLLESFASISETIHDFSRYVPRGMIEELRKEGDVPEELGLEEKVVTVMIVEMVDFCRIAEEACLALNADPTSASPNHLNEFYLGVVEIVEAHGGLVLPCSTAGDAIAVWGATRPVHSANALACCAALHISNLARATRLTAVNQPKDNIQQQQQQSEPLAVRIGIHCGPAIVGNIGCEDHHSEFTVFGNALRYARTLAGTNRAFRLASILCSQEVFDDACQSRVRVSSCVPHSKSKMDVTVQLAARPLCEARPLSEVFNLCNSNNSEPHRNASSIVVMQLIGISECSVSGAARRSTTATAETSSSRAFAEPSSASHHRRQRSQESTTPSAVPVSEDTADDDAHGNNDENQKYPHEQLRRRTILKVERNINDDSSSNRRSSSSSLSRASSTTNDDDDNDDRINTTTKMTPQSHNRRSPSSSASSSSSSSRSSRNHNNSTSVPSNLGALSLFHLAHEEEDEVADKNDEANILSARSKCSLSSSGEDNDEKRLGNGDNNRNTTHAIATRIQSALVRRSASMLESSMAKLVASAIVLIDANALQLLNVFSASVYWRLGDRKRLVEHISAAEQFLKHAAASAATASPKKAGSIISGGSPSSHAMSLQILRRNGITHGVAEQFVRRCKAALRCGIPIFFPQVEVAV